jgi:hypothetical protein
MRKFYAFLAAALMSVSVFAAKDVVPSDADLANYYNPGEVCVCFFVPADMACNDVVVTGSFNGWSSKVEDCILADAVEGFDGWYVAAFEPEAEPDPEKGIQAKPIMLDVDGNFNWDYQVGAATVIRGGVQVVQGGYEGEIDLINYGTDAPNVLTVDAWKNNPCTAIYHNYKITVISNGCDGFVVPFLVGSMNNWTFTQMQLDVEKTVEYMVPTYYITFKAAEGTPYQIVSGLMDEGGEIVVEPSWSDDAYIQVLKDGVWSRITNAEGGNDLPTGEDANILFDLRAEDMRWARCDDSPLEYTCVAVKLPALNCPESVEIIGGFDAWEGTAMEFLNTGYFFAEVEAKASQFFKFRGAGSWDQEIELYDAENDTWNKIGDGQLTFGQLWTDDTWKGTPCKWIELDFGDPEVARWTVAGPTGIENITLTEDAHKVIVDGVLYIVRDNKMFNVQGAQVR